MTQLINDQGFVADDFATPYAPFDAADGIGQHGDQPVAAVVVQQLAPAGVGCQLVVVLAVSRAEVGDGHIVIDAHGGAQQRRVACRGWIRS